VQSKNNYIQTQKDHERVIKVLQVVTNRCACLAFGRLERASANATSEKYEMVSKQEMEDIGLGRGVEGSCK
jgi:hypothetical protein